MAGHGEKNKKWLLNQKNKKKKKEKMFDIIIREK